MKESHLLVHSQPKLENPILIAGLPGIGNIGTIVARLLTEFSSAESFAELYSPKFPDYVLPDNKGVCRPPRYEFYAATSGHNLIILTGTGQPSLEDIPAHYEVCGDVLGFITRLGCRSIVIVGGFPSSQPTKEVFLASTSKGQAEKFVKEGAIIHKGGRIVGMSGLLLGLAKQRGMRGVCLLGSTLGLTADREAANRVYRLLRRVLETNMQEDR